MTTKQLNYGGIDSPVIVERSIDKGKTWHQHVIDRHSHAAHAMSSLTADNPVAYLSGDIRYRWIGGTR